MNPLYIAYSYNQVYQDLFTSCEAKSTVSGVAPASATKTTLSPALGKGTVM